MSGTAAGNRAYGTHGSNRIKLKHEHLETGTVFMYYSCVIFCHHPLKFYIELSYSPKFQLLTCMLSRDICLQRSPKFNSTSTGAIGCALLRFQDGRVDPGNEVAPNFPRNSARNWGEFLNFNKSINWHYHMKVHVEIGMMLLGWAETKLWTLKYGSKSIKTPRLKSGNYDPSWKELETVSSGTLQKMRRCQFIPVFEKARFKTE